MAKVLSSKGSKWQNKSLDILVVTLAILMFLFFYWVDIGRPGPVFTLGWYETWYDQGEYYNMVIGISNGNLGRFLYPIGYPLLGYLGYLLFPADPFFLVNLICFTIFVFLSFKINLKFLDVTLSLITSLIVAMTTINMFVIPWTTTVTAISFLYIIYIAIYEKYDLTSSLLAGLCIYAAFAARIGDLIPLLVSFGIYVLQYFLKNKKISHNTIFALIVFGVLTFITIIVNYQFSGTILGNYGSTLFSGPNSTGFNLINMPYRIFGYLINPFVFEGEIHQQVSVPLIKYCFIFILAPLGLFNLLVEKKTRMYGILFLLAFFGWVVVYTPFIGISGYSLKFTQFHYLKLFFPIFALLSVRFISTITDGSLKNSLLTKNLKNMYLYLLIVIILIYLMLQLDFYPISSDKFMVTATDNVQKVYSAIDGDLNSRWDSAKTQQVGMSFTIDMSDTYLVHRVQVLNTPGSTPNGLIVEISNNGEDWSRLWWVADNTFDPKFNDLFFQPVNTRYLRLSISTDDTSKWWGIHELNIWGR